MPFIPCKRNDHRLLILPMPVVLGENLIQFKAELTLLTNVKKNENLPAFDPFHLKWQTINQKY